MSQGHKKRKVGPKMKAGIVQTVFKKVLDNYWKWSEHIQNLLFFQNWSILYGRRAIQGQIFALIQSLLGSIYSKQGFKYQCLFPVSNLNILTTSAQAHNSISNFKNQFSIWEWSFFVTVPLFTKKCSEGLVLLQ